MKKKFTFLSVILLFLGLPFFSNSQPQFYNYTGSGNGSNSFPFNVAAGKDVQLIYLAGDFNQPSAAPAGNITSVSIFMNGALNATYTNLTIKLAQSTITALTAGAFYTGPMTTVYTRASQLLTNPASSWLTFQLDTPFPYDPTQSLIVDIGQCGQSGTGATCAYTNISGVRRVWSVGGCPFVPYNGSSIYVYNFGFNLATSGPPVVVTTAASAVTSATATLNGTVNANGAATTTSFEYGLTTAYGTTVAGVPVSVTGTTVTPVMAAITGLLPGNTYHYRIKGVNSNGTTNGLDMSFTTTAALPVVVTTAATGITNTTATLNGTVDASGASTAVTFEYGLTTAYGSVVTGMPSPVTGNAVTPVSANITGLTVNNIYHYRITGTNSQGTVNGNDITFNTGCPLPAASGAITGPASVCGNTGGNVYSVPVIAGATGYDWILPAGASITNGSNTNSITVTFANTPGTVSVAATNACGSGTSSSLAVTVNTAPVPTLTGPVTGCVNSGYFTYTTESGKSNYNWTVSAGGTISWGQGTNQALVTWTGSGAQTVSVNYMNTNGCYAIAPVSLPVTITPVPGNAGSITGTATVCEGATGISYSTAPIPGTIAYVWSLPAGAVISSGEFTNAITVDFLPGSVSGNITVYGNNLCGNGTISPAFTVNVNPLPEDAGTITGPVSVCTGATGVTYSVPAISNATGYQWIVPAGVNIVTGGNTSSVTVDFPDTPGQGKFTVTGTNSCGNGVVSPDLEVMINAIPVAPVITASGPVLTSDAANGNQWYYSAIEGDPGTAISGAIGQTYTATQTGWYHSIVTIGGCSSETSNTEYVIMVGQEEHMADLISIYPVPNDGKFLIEFPAEASGLYTIKIYNSTGKTVGEISSFEINGKMEKQIDLRPVANGIYTVVIQGKTIQTVKKIVVKN